MQPNQTWRTAVARSAWLAGLAGLALVLLASCSKPAADKPRRQADEAVPVTVAPVELIRLDRTIAVVGTLFSKDEATLGAEVEGRVERTFVEFGDRVLANQLLAQIDTTTYDALARQATANLERARANAANIEISLRRTQELRKDSIASQSDLDAASAEAEQARASVRAAESAEVVARLNLARSNVKAPFDAAVAERIASAGDFLRVGSQLFRVVNDGVLKFIFQVPERYGSQVQKDQPVTFTVDAWPGATFAGKVYLVSPQVTIATRAFNVGALVENADRKLKASTFARGELVLQREVPTPMVPLEAVVVFAGVSKVFVVESQVARAREVQVGRIREGRQEVVSGLKPGEAVAVSGQTKLFDGAKVRVRP
jgi:membrane fusion protein, multidrug efflux system